MIDYVYILNHTYGVTDEEEEENWKQLGVYSSTREAESAIQRFLQQPGFKDYPEGFIINKYRLDNDHNGWEEGFVTH